MGERRVYHVIRSDDSWQVIKQGFHRPHFVREEKEEAVLLAKRLAKSHPESQVIVHSEDDLVESEFRYTGQL